MKTKNVVPWALWALLLWTGAAWAGNDVHVVNFYVKGGVGRYTADYTSYTGYGGTWGAGFAIQPLSFFGFEVGYDGSHNSTLGALFPDTNRPGILRSGVSLLAKLSAPLGWFRPFIGAGGGVSWLTPTGPGTSFLRGSFIEELPVAGGLEFAVGPVIFGARITYHFLFNNNAILDPARATIRGGLADVQLYLSIGF